MLPEFEWKCKEAIKRNITLPKNNWLVINESSMRLCYIDVSQSKIKYINLPKEEAAKFLTENGIIYMYCLEGDVIKLFIKTLITITGTHNEPVQEVRTIEIKWNDLDQYIFQSHVIHFATDKEFEEKGNM